MHHFNASIRHLHFSEASRRNLDHPSRRVFGHPLRGGLYQNRPLQAFYHPPSWGAETWGDDHQSRCDEAETSNGRGDTGLDHPCRCSDHLGNDHHGEDGHHEEDDHHHDNDHRGDNCPVRYENRPRLRERVVHEVPCHPGP